MSLEFSGAASSRLNRTTNLPASTSSFTMCFWVKRLGSFADLRCLTALHNPGPTDGHDFVIDPSYSGQEYVPNVQVNWASQQIYADEVSVANTWQFYCLVGSGTNFYLKYYDGPTLISEVVQQTVLTLNRIWIGDGGVNNRLFNGRFAHIRIWDAALSDAEVAAEKASATPVRTANLKVATSCTGANKAEALTGEVGGAWTEGSGGVSLSADQPTFDSFDGPVISGEAYMPAGSEGQEEPEEGDRVNRWLWSEDPTQWPDPGRAALSAAATPPAGWPSARRFRLPANATGGAYGLIPNVPSGDHVVSGIFRMVDAVGLCLRNMTSDFGNGAQGHFNLQTGGWSNVSTFGSATDAWSSSVPLGGGWYLLTLGVGGLAAGSRVAEFYPLETPGVQIPASGKAVDAGGFQYEPGRIPHYYKPAGASMETRSLATINGALSVANISVGGQSTFFGTLLDNEGAPWDQAGAVVFSQTDDSKASLTPGSQTSDWSGTVYAILQGLAAGTTAVKAAYAGIESTPVNLTVGAGVSTKWVRIRCEPGWHGSVGWLVGVWETPGSGNFPSTKLFEATSQVFKVDPYAGTNESYMDVAVPSDVTVTVGQQVLVALKNNNINGVAVDGPAVFSALVIG